MSQRPNFSNIAHMVTIEQILNQVDKVLQLGKPFQLQLGTIYECGEVMKLLTNRDVPFILMYNQNAYIVEVNSPEIIAIGIKNKNTAGQK